LVAILVETRDDQVTQDQLFRCNCVKIVAKSISCFLCQDALAIFGWWHFTLSQAENLLDGMVMAVQWAGLQIWG
jgi:hypothetical protein